VTRILQKHSFFWLTLALVLLMLTGAFAREFPSGVALHLVQYSSIVLLLLSLLSLGDERKRQRWFVAIVGLMLLSAVWRHATGSVPFEYAYLGMFAAFLLLAAWLVARRVLFTGAVSLNTLVGSVALYLLIGLIFSIVYTALLEVSPDAIRGVEPAPWYMMFPTMTYFSFVTLATLGYGDISPASPIAQVIVILEAVTGAFYMAIVVASLIGAYFGQYKTSDSE
jgi:voltage-gated potassium channel Kch